MEQILRVGDSGPGTCYSHAIPISVIGTIIEGEVGTTVSPDGTQIAREGSIVELTCGHTGTLVASVDNITIDGKKLGRYNDVWTDGTGDTDGVIVNVGTGITESDT